MARSDRLTFETNLVALVGFDHYGVRLLSAGFYRYPVRSGRYVELDGASRFEFAQGMVVEHDREGAATTGGSGDEQTGISRLGCFDRRGWDGYAGRF